MMDLPPRRKRQPRTLNYLSCTFCRKAKLKCIPNSKRWPQEKCARCTQKDLACSAPQRKTPHADVSNKSTHGQTPLIDLIHPFKSRLISRSYVDATTTHDAMHALLQMAVEEMYAIGEAYLTPIEHDTIWSYYSQRLKECTHGHTGIIERLRGCIERFQEQVAQDIVTATLDLESSSRAMDGYDLSDQDECINRYEELGHHGIVYIVQLRRLKANPALTCKEALRLIRCRRLFFTEWASLSDKAQFDQWGEYDDLVDIGIDISETQLFVPKSLCQFPTILADLKKDGRRDCLGRSTHLVQHDAGFHLPWPAVSHDETDTMHRSIAHIACFKNDTALLEQLLVSPSYTWEKSLPGLGHFPPLHLAAMRGNTKVFESMQRMTSKSFFQRRLDEMSPYTKRTCLHWAASCGHLETVDFICLNTFATKVGHTYDRRVRTALHLAARYGHIDVVRRLCQSMDREAIAHSDDYGCSAFWYAASRNYVEILEVLQPSLFSYQSYRHIYTPHRNIYTPLAIAAMEGHAEVVRYLLQHRAYPNNVNSIAMDEDLNSPLGLAIKGGHNACIELLERAGAVRSAVIIAAENR